MEVKCSQTNLTTKTIFERRALSALPELLDFFEKIFLNKKMYLSQSRSRFPLVPIGDYPAKYIFAAMRSRAVLKLLYCVINLLFAFSCNIQHLIEYYVPSNNLLE